MITDDVTTLAKDAMRRHCATGQHVTASPQPSVTVTSEPHPLGTEFIVDVYWASTKNPSRLLGFTQAFVVPLNADGRAEDTIVREIMNSAAETERKDGET